MGDSCSYSIVAWRCPLLASYGLLWRALSCGEEAETKKDRSRRSIHYIGGCLFDSLSLYIIFSAEGGRLKLVRTTTRMNEKRGGARHGGGGVGRR